MRKLYQTDHYGNSWPTVLPPELTLPGGILNVALPILLYPGSMKTDNGTIDTLISNEFRVLNNLGAVVWSGAGLGAVAIPLLTLTLGGDYTVQQRTRGLQLGYSPWSDPISLRIG